MIAVLETAFFVASIASAYIFWFRRIMRSRPALNVFVQRTDNLRNAICMKFQGIKHKLFGAMIMTASGIVALHDLVMPYILGIDWTPVTTKIPTWAWPFIIFAFTFLLDQFRRFADERHGR